MYSCNGKSEFPAAITSVIIIIYLFDSMKCCLMQLHSKLGSNVQILFGDAVCDYLIYCTCTDVCKILFTHTHTHTQDLCVQYNIAHSS